MNSAIKIKINNWQKYNGRNDVKNPTWFRMSNSVFEDHELYGCNALELAFWIYLLSLASRKQSEEIVLNPDHARNSARFHSLDIEGAIEKLEQYQCITVERNVHVTSTLRARNVRVTSTYATDRQTDRQTDRHTSNLPANAGQREPEASHPLVELWNSNSAALPKSRGKLSPQRKKKCVYLWKQSETPQEYFTEVIRRIAASDFCLGKVTKWRATFDWLLQPDVHLKVMDGKYDNPGASKEKLEYVKL